MKVKEVEKVLGQNSDGENEVQKYVGVNQLIEFGKTRGWEFKVLGRAPLPTQEEKLRNWTLIPEEQDNNITPWNAKGKMQAIEKAGLVPRGYVIAHERSQDTPKVEINKPKEKHEEKQSVGIEEGFTQSVSDFFDSAIADIGTFLPLGIAALFLIDPVLIAVTNDYTWVEIDRWWVRKG